MFMSLLRSRRSIRRYEDRKIPAETAELLAEAVLRAPSSRSIRPWEFIFVDDADSLAKLARSKEHGSSFLDGAPLGIVICGDETRSDVWVEDCSIAAILIQLAAHSMKLGSCWVQIRKRMHKADETAEDYVRGLLGIPKHLRVECIIGVGYPAENKDGVPAENLGRGKIRWNAFEGRTQGSSGGSMKRG